MSKSDKHLVSICDKCPGQTCFPIAMSTDPMPPVDEAPPFCPMRRFPQLMKQVESEYERPEIREFARLASVQEAECYEVTRQGIRTKIPRLEETIQFAQKCNYKRIGIAFCIGLKEEASMVAEILAAKGMEVVSVNCKVGGVPKKFIGLTDEEKILRPGIMETMCNPIAQAEVLNAERVDLAVMLGLCVGHDTLFLRYVSVPCTVLAVKDRVFGHNPLAAVYLSRSPYYGRLRTAAAPSGEGEKATLPQNVRGR